MHAKHLEFWDKEEIQQFWSGASFSRADDGNMLSYELARIIVEQFAHDHASFARFVLAADRSEAGAAAAREVFGVDLGEYACALLEREPHPDFSPDPRVWAGAPGAPRGAARPDPLCPIIAREDHSRTSTGCVLSASRKR